MMSILQQKGYMPISCTLDKLLQKVENPARIYNAHRTCFIISENPLAYFKLDVLVNNMAVYWVEPDEANQSKVCVGFIGRFGNIILLENRIKELEENGYVSLSAKDLDGLKNSKGFFKFDYSTISLSRPDEIMRSKRPIHLLKTEEIRFIESFFGKTNGFEALLKSYQDAGFSSVSFALPLEKDIIEAAKGGKGVAFLCCFESLARELSVSELSLKKRKKESVVINLTYSGPGPGKKIYLFKEKSEYIPIPG